MTIYKFSISWDAEIEIDDALDEDEAWDMAYAKVEETFRKHKGSVTVELVPDEETTNWGLFDTDPEEQDITFISLDEADYL